MMNQKQANITERKVLRNGTVLYTVKGSQGYEYMITMKDGEIDPLTHQDCLGFAHCGHCYHVRDIEAIESELIGEAKLAKHMADMMEQYAEDTRPTGLAESYKANWYPKTSL